MGPDMYTLRAMIELELALDSEVQVDAAHALLSDGVTAAFGARWYEWLTQALTAEGRNPEDLSVVLSDDRIADRVLERMRTRMGGDDEAPDPPDTDYVWSAYSPDDPGGGRERYRRAVRERKEKARRSLVDRPRPRVAGPRDR